MHSTRAISNFTLPHNLSGSDRDFDSRGCRDSGFRAEFRSAHGGAGGEDAAVRVAAGPSFEASVAAEVSGICTRHKAIAVRSTASDIYDNGPINGNTDAWTINFGFIVSDSFTIANDQTLITGMSFGAWLFSGDTLTSVEVSITSGENSGTSYFDQTVTLHAGKLHQQPVRLQRLHRDRYLQWAHAECGNLLGESAECQRPQRRSGLLGREFRRGMSGSGLSIAGFAEFGRLDSVGGVHHSGQRDRPPPRTYSDLRLSVPQHGFHDLHDFSPNAGPVGGGNRRGGERSTGRLLTAAAMAQGLLYDFAQSRHTGLSARCITSWEAATEAVRTASSSAREGCFTGRRQRRPNCGYGLLRADL